MRRTRFSETKGAEMWVGKSLYDVASEGETAVVRQLLSQGTPTEVAGESETPLYIASANGHLEVVKCLLDAKANVNRSTRSNATPLYVATQFGRQEVVELLLQRQSDPNLGMYGEITPLMLAARTGAFKMVK